MRASLRTGLAVAALLVVPEAEVDDPRIEGQQLAGGEDPGIVQIAVTRPAETVVEVVVVAVAVQPGQQLPTPMPVIF